MSFHFRLATLLRVRQAFEDRERQELERVLRDLYHLKERQQAMRNEGLKLRAEEARALSRGLIGAELHLLQWAIKAQDAVIVEYDAHVTQQQQQVLEQQKRYQHARQQREIITNLRQRQLAAHQVIEARKAQQQSDDLFLVRQGSRRHG